MRQAPAAAAPPRSAAGARGGRAHCAEAQQDGLAALACGGTYMRCMRAHMPSRFLSMLAPLCARCGLSTGAHRGESKACATLQERPCNAAASPVTWRCGRRTAEARHKARVRVQQAVK